MSKLSNMSYGTLWFGGNSFPGFLYKKNGGGGLGQAVTVFAPMLLKAGMTEATLKMILNDNPRAFLAFVPKA